MITPTDRDRMRRVKRAQITTPLRDSNGHLVSLQQYCSSSIAPRHYIVPRATFSIALAACGPAFWVVLLSLSTQLLTSSWPLVVASSSSSLGCGTETSRRLPTWLRCKLRPRKQDNTRAQLKKGVWRQREISRGQCSGWKWLPHRLRGLSGWS